jgi:hypothetical protein
MNPLGRMIETILKLLLIVITLLSLPYCQHHIVTITITILVFTKRIGASSSTLRKYAPVSIIGILKKG